MNILKVNIKLLTDDSLIPKAQHWDDAGCDLFSAENCIIAVGQRKLISTGVAIEIPQGYVGLIHSRSGMAHKNGIFVLNAPGVIDPGYRGDVKVNLMNLGDNPYIVKSGDRIAQLLIQQYMMVDFQTTEELGYSFRSENGHGSTG